MVSGKKATTTRPNRNVVLSNVSACLVSNPSIAFTMPERINIGAATMRPTLKQKLVPVALK